MRAPALLIAALVALAASPPPPPPSSSPYAPVIGPGSATPTGPAADVSEVSCDDPFEKMPDCDAKARTQCGGTFEVVARTTSESPPAGPWRSGRGASHDHWAPEDESDGAAAHWTRRTLSFRCVRSS